MTNAKGGWPKKIHFFARAALLIVDEIGYPPISQCGTSLFFQTANASCETSAIIPTSNRGFAEWDNIFGAPVVTTTLLDRLLRNAGVIRSEGASCRLRKQADLIPEHVRANAPIMPPLKTRGRTERETRIDD